MRRTIAIVALAGSLLGGARIAGVGQHHVVKQQEAACLVVWVNVPLLPNLCLINFGQAKT